MARCAHCTQKLPKRAVVCPYCGYPVPPNTQHNANAPGNLTPILAGGIAGLVLVILLGVGALFGYKGGWLDFGPRRSHSVTAIAYRLDDGLPYLSLYIGRPDEHTFDLPAGVYYIEAFDQAGQGVSLGRVTVKAEDGVSAASVFPRDFAKGSQLLSAQETAQVQTLAEFLVLVDYARLTYIEIISNGYTTTPYGGDEDIQMSALEPMQALFAEMAQSDKAVTDAAQFFQKRALTTAAAPVKATMSARRWFNLADKFRSFFGQYNKNAESARNEIVMVYNAMTPEQRAESFNSVNPNIRGGAQTYDEFVQKIKDGDISDSDVVVARGQFHYDIEYEDTVQRIVPGMNRPHLNIAHQEGGAAVTAGAELYVEIIKSVLTTRFPDIKNGMDYAEKADKWSNYVRDLFSDPTKAFENFTSDQIKDYLSEQIKADLGEINPGLPDDEIEEMAGALADRITQQVVADVKAGGGMVVDAVTGLAETEPADTDETEAVEETEPAEPDLSWIPGYVNGVGSTLKDRGLRNAAIDAIKNELSDCLEAEVKLGATQEEAISICQYIVDQVKEPTATPEPTAEEARNFGGSWFGGGACDEGDDPAYRWNVSLAQDASGHVSGTISFHACPGGGAVFYSVSGQATSSSTLVLQGSKTGGRGDLGANTPSSVQFSIKYKKAPNPNYGG